MPLGMWGRVGHSHHVLDGGLDPNWGMANFGVGKGPPHSKVKGQWTVSPKETAGSIEMAFGVWWAQVTMY